MEAQIEVICDRIQAIRTTEQVDHCENLGTLHDVCKRLVAVGVLSLGEAGVIALRIDSLY